MNDDDFDKFVEELQKEIIQKELEVFNEKIVEIFHNPKNWGKMEGEDIISEAYRGPCGDLMEFYLKIKDGIIEKATFITDGCGASVAAGSQTTILIEGKDIEYAKNLKPEDIDKALNGLPEDHKHCAELCVRTLRKVLKKYNQKQ